MDSLRSSEELLDCCRDSLVLLAEVETAEGAAKLEPGQLAWRGRCGDRCPCSAQLGIVHIVTLLSSPVSCPLSHRHDGEGSTHPRSRRPNSTMSSR